jgi:rhodanese-related sulfurtransferase
MDQLTQFIARHWELCVALLVILVLILLNERQSQKKKAKEISPQAAITLMNHEDAIVVDLRDAAAFEKGHIINAIRATEEDFEQERMKKNKSKTIIITCARGIRSSGLASKLQDQGYKQVLVLSGGITAWQNTGLPLTKGK